MGERVEQLREDTEPHELLSRCVGNRPDASGGHEMVRTGRRDGNVAKRHDRRGPRDDVISY